MIICIGDQKELLTLFMIIEMMTRGMRELSRLRPPLSVYLSRMPAGGNGKYFLHREERLKINGLNDVWRNQYLPILCSVDKKTQEKWMESKTEVWMMKLKHFKFPALPPPACAFRFFRIERFLWNLGSDQVQSEIYEMWILQRKSSQWRGWGFQLKHENIINWPN